jgi:uncharacterized protein (TIGR03067 family)
MVTAAPGRSADDPPKAKSPAERLQGTWLFDDARLGKWNQLHHVEESIVTVAGESFTLSKFLGAKSDLKGTLVFDASDPTAVDLKLAGLDLTTVLPGYNIPACTLSGRFKLDGDRLTLCFARHPAGKRPAALATTDDHVLAVLVRAPKGFKEFPKEFTLTALRPDGKPAAGATVCEYLVHAEDSSIKEPMPGLNEIGAQKTDADGKVVLKKAPVRSRLLVRDSANGTMAIVFAPPARLAQGPLRAELVPAVRVRGTVTYDDPTKTGQRPPYIWAMCFANGVPFTEWSSLGAKFEFVAPPSTYTLLVSGQDCKMKTVDVTVGPNQTELVLEPIALQLNGLVGMKGKPAPELEGVVGWRGEKVKFADLKGKYVLVEFWGYWCGPCVHSMPVLIELHEKYADKGLAIVGVHVDLDGEVDAAAKLDSKIAVLKKDKWNGKDLPFPNVLASGEQSKDKEKRRNPATQYDIPGYPTCLLIDREGKLIGEFAAHDIKKASEEIEKLLAKKK